MTPEQQPVVQQQPVAVVTLQEIYSTLQGVQRTVEKIDSTLAQVVKDSEDHEVRLRSLEAARWKIFGGATTLGGVLGFIGNKLLGG